MRIQKFTIIAVLGIALIAFAVTIVRRAQTGSSPGWSRIYRAIRNPRKAYALWLVDRESRAVMRLIREADVCLQADRDGFTCSKPLGPDGGPVRILAKDLAAGSILAKGTPRAVTIKIPTDWMLEEQTTKASGTGMEDFALEAATRLKACAFHRITVYQSSYGLFWRVLDGNIPSRQTIDATIRRQKAMFSGL